MLTDGGGYLSEALFEFAFSDMLWKAMTPEDLEEMARLNRIMFPQQEMRDDAAAIHEHAGIGGTSSGFRRAGIPTAMGVDAWDAINTVRRPYEENTMTALLGIDQGMAHPDDQIELYADALAGRKAHIGFSPPCQKLTSAGNAGLSAAEREARALEGIPPIFNSFYTAQEMQKHPDIDLNSWHMEQAKEAIPILLKYPKLLDGLDRDFRNKVFAMLRGDGTFGMPKQNPRMNAIDYGAPSTRNRMIIGEGWTKNPTHYDRTRRKKPVAGRLPSRSILDFAPHLQREWEENKGLTDEWIRALVEHGRLTPTGARELGDGPQISLSGATVPGKGNTGPEINALGMRGGGSVWDDARGPRNKQRRSFSHSYPANRHTSGQTHNRPTLMFNRPLTDEEWLAVQTFDPKYNTSPIDGLTHRTYTTGKQQKVFDTGVGNVVVPAVGGAIASSAFGPSARQRTLLERY